MRKVDQYATIDGNDKIQIFLLDRGHKTLKNMMT
jgi:hypothetical protein